MADLVIYSIAHNSELIPHQIPLERELEPVDQRMAYELLKVAKEKFSIKGKMFLVVVQGKVFFVGRDARDKKQSKIYKIEVGNEQSV